MIQDFENLKRGLTRAFYQTDSEESRAKIIAWLRSYTNVDLELLGSLKKQGLDTDLDVCYDYIEQKGKNYHIEF